MTFTVANKCFRLSPLYAREKLLQQRCFTRSGFATDENELAFSIQSLSQQIIEIADLGFASDEHLMLICACTIIPQVCLCPSNHGRYFLAIQ